MTQDALNAIMVALSLGVTGLSTWLTTVIVRNRSSASSRSSGAGATSSPPPQRNKTTVRSRRSPRTIMLRPDKGYSVVWDVDDINTPEIVQRGRQEVEAEVRARATASERSLVLIVTWRGIFVNWTRGDRNG